MCTEILFLAHWHKSFRLQSLLQVLIESLRDTQEIICDIGKKSVFDGKTYVTTPSGMLIEFTCVILSLHRSICLEHVLFHRSLRVASPKGFSIRSELLRRVLHNWKWLLSLSENHRYACVFTNVLRNISYFVFLPPKRLRCTLSSQVRQPQHRELFSRHWCTLMALSRAQTRRSVVHV